jgi:hypothetical protein
MGQVRRSSRSFSDAEEKQKNSIIKEVKELRAANPGITAKEWISGLTKGMYSRSPQYLRKLPGLRLIILLSLAR